MTEAHLAKISVSFFDSLVMCVEGTGKEFSGFNVLEILLRDLSSRFDRA